MQQESLYTEVDPDEGFRSPTPLEVTWHAEAACYRLWYENPGDDIFFVDTKTESIRKTVAAKQWCYKPCPVRSECLKSSLEFRDKFGVWGGLSFDERKKLLDRIDAGEITLDEAVRQTCEEGE